MCRYGERVWKGDEEIPKHDLICKDEPGHNPLLATDAFGAYRGGTVIFLERVMIRWSLTLELSQRPLRAFSQSSYGATSPVSRTLIGEQWHLEVLEDEKCAGVECREKASCSPCLRSNQ